MKRSRRMVRYLPLLLLTGLWALLYLPHLRTSPGWYSDETLIHHTARDLAAGQATNLGLWNTFWHPHYPYQPVYTFLCGIFARAAGGDIWGSRLFNVILALLTAWAIYGLGRRVFAARPAAFSACLFLCYTQSVIHFRMAYAHNMAGLGLVIMTLFLLKPARFRTDLRAGLGLMVAAGSHPLFIHGAIAAGLTRLKRPHSWIPLFAPAALYLVLCFGGVYLSFGNWLWEDLNHLKDVFTSRGEQDGGGLRGLINFLLFMTQDWFHLGILFGLLACLNRRYYAVTLVGGFVLFMLVKNRQNLVTFYYQAVVILPVLCLAWAGLYAAMVRILRRWRLPGRGWIPRAAWVLPAAALAATLPSAVSGNLIPRNHYWVTQSPQEVEAAAAWINAHAKPGDFVAANPNIGWLLKTRFAPYLQIVTWYGLPTQGYENGNKPERFRFDTSLENARYAVVGDVDQRWAFGEPNVREVVKKLQEENWPVVWSGEFYAVLANPRFSSAK